MITVADVMTTQLHTCKSHETLDQAAKIMWERNCAQVPIVDDLGFLVAMVSDRSACLCAYTQGKVMAQIPVTSAAVDRMRVIGTEDSLDLAHEVMRTHGLRCLPVVERTGRLVGILSITDIIRKTSLQGEPRLSATSVAAAAPRRG